MAFPTISGSDSNKEAAAGTSHSVYLDACVKNDLLFVCFSASTGSTTITPPSGWTAAGVYGGTNVRTGIYYKKATGTGDGNKNYTFTTSASKKCSWATYVITPQAGMWVGCSGTSATATSTNPNPPSHAPGIGLRDFLWLVPWGSGWNSATPSATPTNFANQIGQTGNSVDVPASWCADDTNAVSSYDPGTWTCTGSVEWICWTVAFWEYPDPSGAFFALFD